MSAQVGRLVVCAAIHEGQRVIDLVGISKTIPATAGVARCPEGGIERLGRIESLLHVIHGSLVLLHVSKHPHFDGQQVTEHPLVHVHVAGKVVQFVVQDNAGMIHVTQRDSITRTVAATHEGNVMVLQKCGLFDSLLPVGAVALIDRHKAHGTHCANVAIGI